MRQASANPSVDSAAGKQKPPRVSLAESNADVTSTNNHKTDAVSALDPPGTSKMIVWPGNARIGAGAARSPQTARAPALAAEAPSRAPYVSAGRRDVFELDQRHAAVHQLARARMHGAHAAVARRAHQMLHLHRLDGDQRLAPGHRIARAHQHARDHAR